MFSDAISSISSRWRPSSLPMTSAISGSASASEAEKKESATVFAEDSGMDIALSRDGFGLPYRPKTAKAWMRGAHSRNMLISRQLFPLETQPQLLQRQLLQIGLRGAGRPHRRNLDAGPAIDRGHLHHVADRGELEIDLVFAVLGHELSHLRGLSELLEPVLDLFRLLIRQHVAGACDHRRRRVAKAGLEVVGVAWRHHPVFGAEQNERRTGDARQPPPQTTVGDRPDELGHRGEA